MPPTLPRRRRDASKHDFGRLLIVAGSVGYTGAPTLAARAAVRGGAGLVYLGVPERIYAVTAVKNDEAMPVSSFMWHLSGAPEPPRRRLTARAQPMSPIACSAGRRAMSPAMKAGLGASISTGAVTPAARSSAASS